MCYDVLAVFAASIVALLIRFDLNIKSVPFQYMDEVWRALPFMIIVTLIIFWMLRLYSSLWSYAGALEMMYVVSACILDTVVVTVLILLRNWGDMYPVPRSFYILYGLFLFVFVMGCRYSYRGLRVLRNMRRAGVYRRNVLVIGAGDAGNQIIKEINNSRYVKKKVVGVIDDDRNKIGNYIHGAKVVGDRSDILEKVEELHVHEIIIAMPSATQKQIKGILDICKETGCTLKRLPGIYQLVNGDVSVSKLKDVDVNDLLGRDPVTVDLQSIMDYVSGKIIMVTGGGGSIGSELCRQIAAHKPKQLIIVDIYENTTYDVQNELKVRFPELDLVVLIASVRNTNRMNWIFEHYKPEIIYHAAAHKHVPLMEESPNEAIKNNVFGTYKTARAADKFGVKRFVLISTDKAVNPTNIMGASKRMCEMIIQTFNRYSKTEYVAVRFGNVLGSNGSVIPLFKRQMAAGGPLTVTHPDIIRYFMTIPEAVSLVLEAGAFAKGGEIFVLDMGEPVKIADLAKNLIRLSGYTLGVDMDIKYTGLRPGEKLYEELLVKEEGIQKTDNNLIYIGKPLEFNEVHFLSGLRELEEAAMNESLSVKQIVSEIVPTYHIRQEDLKRDEEVNKELRELGKISHEKPVMED